MCIIAAFTFKEEEGIIGTKGDWSSGMIPVLGTGGPGFNSRIAPFFLPFPSNISNKGRGITWLLSSRKEAELGINLKSRLYS